MNNCVSINLKKDQIIIKISEDAEQKQIIAALSKKLTDLKKLYKEDKTPIMIVGKVLKNKEIYAQGNAEDDQVFGYQEAWADYRYKPNRVTGEMRSAYAQSLDVWHLADDYSQRPSLSDSWIREDKTNIDRVLAVTSANSNQFFADIYVQNRATRPMPMYSVPGLEPKF